MIDSESAADHGSSQQTGHEAQASEMNVDPVEASMQQLLAILTRERPSAASELSRCWDRVCLEYEALCQQCLEPNEEFVERKVKEKLDDLVIEYEAELELLKGQVDFLDETLITESVTADKEEDQELRQELELTEQLIEMERNSHSTFEPDENTKPEQQAAEAQTDDNQNCQELNDLNIQLKQARMTMMEIENRTGSQSKLRDAIRSLIQKKVACKEPFAIALNVLDEHNGVLAQEEFKSKVGDLLNNRSEVVSLMYSMVGQGLIQIDRSVGNGIVKSSIILM